MDIAELTHEHFAAHVGTAFSIHTDNHVEVLTLKTVEPGSKYLERESFALVFHGSSNDLMFHSQMVRLDHAEMGPLDIMISPIGRNEDGTYKYEAVFT